MDLRQLRTFVTVAELGSLTKAAERLRTAQPALSRQIRLLEEELDASLFLRHARGMVLTQDGEFLFERARSILSQVDEVRGQFSSKKGNLTGQVTLALPPSVVDVLAGRLTKRFASEHSDAMLRVVGGMSGFVMDWLQTGKIDLALFYDVRPDPGLHTVPILREPLYLVTPFETAPKGLNAFPFRDLGGQKLVLPSTRHCVRALLERRANELDVPLDVIVETDSLGVQKNLIEQGIGSSVLPLSAVLNELSRGAVAALPLTEPELIVNLYLGFPVDRAVPTLVQRLASLLMEEIRSIVAAKIWQGQLINESGAGVIDFQDFARKRGRQTR